MGKIAVLLIMSLLPPSATVATQENVVREAWDAVAKTYVYMPSHRAEWQRARAQYVKVYKGPAQSHAAIRGMVATLKNSRLQWLSAEDVKTIVPQFSGPLPILGLAYLSFEFLPGEKKVITALANSPAAQVGIQTGDILQSVNGARVEKMSPGELVRLLGRIAEKPANLVLSRNGQTVRLSVQPSGKELDPVTLTMSSSGTAMRADIVVREFTLPALKQFEEAVKAAAGKHTTEYTIDLRNNPGGLVDVMLDMAALFVSEKDFLCAQNGAGKTNCRKTKTGTPVGGRVTILVAEGTASAAEVFAAGFQRTRRGQVIGCHTYGHGLGGQLTVLSDGSALLIPDTTYLNPDGQPIEGRGIMPDVMKCPVP